MVLHAPSVWESRSPPEISFTRPSTRSSPQRLEPGSQEGVDKAGTGLYHPLLSPDSLKGPTRKGLDSVPGR
jgi:hypothetical protein